MIFKEGLLPIFSISKYKMCHYFVSCVKMLDQYLNNQMQQDNEQFN